MLNNNKTPGFKLKKERKKERKKEILTILLCTNSTGDDKLLQLFLVGMKI